MRACVCAHTPTQNTLVDQILSSQQHGSTRRSKSKLPNPYLNVFNSRNESCIAQRLWPQVLPHILIIQMRSLPVIKVSSCFNICVSTAIRCCFDNNNNLCAQQKVLSPHALMCTILPFSKQDSTLAKCMQQKNAHTIVDWLGCWLGMPELMTKHKAGSHSTATTLMFNETTYTNLRPSWGDEQYKLVHQGRMMYNTSMHHDRKLLNKTSDVLRTKSTTEGRFHSGCGSFAQVEGL